MILFSTFLFKLLPLYLNILLGYVAGKVLHTPREAIGKLMFYLINPLVMFNGILYTKIDAAILFLPILIWTISSSLCLIFLKLSNNLWKDSTKNLTAFSAGTANSGYFGLPLALLLLDKQGEGIYMISIVGIALYESSVGFYILAKGHYSAIDCLKKLIRLPTLYALTAALLLNYFQMSIPLFFKDFMCHIKGTFIVLGMMIVGISLAGLNHFKIDLKFIGMTFLAKFVFWPGLMLGLIYLDTYFFHLFTSDNHQALLLLSLVPLAVNTVILASVLNAEPEKAAVAILLSTLFALIYVPFMVIYFMPETAEAFSQLYCPV